MGVEHMSLGFKDLSDEEVRAIIAEMVGNDEYDNFEDEARFEVHISRVDPNRLVPGLN